jgi:hypothetical protein
MIKVKDIMDFRFENLYLEDIDEIQDKERDYREYINEATANPIKELNSVELKKNLKNLGIKIKDFVETNAIFSITLYKIDDEIYTNLNTLLKDYDFKIEVSKKSIIIFKP